MSDRTISLKAGDTLTVAYVLQGDEPVATSVPVADKPKRKFCKRRKGESDESLAARKAELQANAPVAVPVVAVVPVVAPVAPVTAPAGSDLGKLIGAAAPVEAKPKVRTQAKTQAPLCKAVAIVRYFSEKSGKTSDQVLWKMGTNARGDWFRMRWVGKDDKEGFATGPGYWGKLAGFKGIVAEGDALKKLCGCVDCLKLRS